MEQLSVRDTNVVGGGGFSLGGWAGSWVLSKVANYVYDQVMAGNIDYAGVAEQQGTYYNTVGA